VTPGVVYISQCILHTMETIDEGSNADSEELKQPTYFIFDLLALKTCCCWRSSYQALNPDGSDLPYHLQEPSWLDVKRGFYFGLHASMWRIRFWNTMIWIAAMCFIVLMYFGGFFWGIESVYIGTAACWAGCLLFRDTTLTATCLVGTCLSIWEGGESISKYWRIQVGNVDA
jgi:hypothetical protein